MAWCHQAPSHYLNHVDQDLWSHMASLDYNDLCPTAVFLILIYGKQDLEPGLLRNFHVKTPIS